MSTNIDDMTPEELSYAADILRTQALDVDIQAIYMKKSRLAFKLSILCVKDKKEALLSAMFKETSTIGIKEENILRHSLKREFVEVNTVNGKILAKKVFLNGKFLKEKLEFDQRAELATKKNMSILDLKS